MTAIRNLADSYLVRLAFLGLALGLVPVYFLSHAASIL